MLKHLNTKFVKPNRVVVLGAKGFVGSAVINKLNSRAIDVLGLTRDEVDLITPNSDTKLANYLKPDDVIVIAAAIAPCKNRKTFIDNMLMMQNICEALQQKPPKHLIYISSDAVYADVVTLTEGSATVPTSLHGMMHLAREMLLKDALKDIPLVFLRPSLLYGRNDPHNGYGPNRFLRLVKDGSQIPLFGNGEELRDHVYIEDLAEIVSRCIAARSIGKLNVATGQVHSFMQIAQKIIELSGKKIKLVSQPRSGPMPHNGYRPFRIHACQAAFPDFRYTSLENGLANCIEEVDLKETV